MGVSKSLAAARRSARMPRRADLVTQALACGVTTGTSSQRKTPVACHPHLPGGVGAWALLRLLCWKVGHEADTVAQQHVGLPAVGLAYADSGAMSTAPQCSGVSRTRRTVRQSVRRGLRSGAVVGTHRASPPARTCSAKVGHPTWILSVFDAHYAVAPRTRAFATGWPLDYDTR